jgi:hypothetical protein
MNMVTVCNIHTWKCHIETHYFGFSATWTITFLTTLSHAKRRKCSSTFLSFAERTEDDACLQESSGSNPLDSISCHQNKKKLLELQITWSSALSLSHTFHEEDMVNPNRWEQLLCRHPIRLKSLATPIPYSMDNLPVKMEGIFCTLQNLSTDDCSSTLHLQLTDEAIGQISSIPK